MILGLVDKISGDARRPEFEFEEIHRSSLAVMKIPDVVLNTSLADEYSYNETTALKFFDARSGEMISMFEPGRGVTSRASVDPNKGEVYFISADANIFALGAQWKRYAKDWPWE